MTDFLSRARGALVGLAVGDALGTTNEFKVVGTFTPSTGMVGGGAFQLEPGQWTDDTSMALCLADSLLAQGRYDSFDVMERYERWYSEGYRSSTGVCFDIGNQVSRALWDFRANPRVPVDAVRTTSAGNGAIMRLAPVVIAGFEARDPHEIVATAGLSARETHFSAEAEAATEVFAALLVGALLGWAPERIVDVAWASTGAAFDDVAARVISADPTERASWEAHTSGYIIHGLRLAVHACSMSVLSMRPSWPSRTWVGTRIRTPQSTGSSAARTVGSRPSRPRGETPCMRVSRSTRWLARWWNCAWRHRSRASTRTCRARPPPSDRHPPRRDGRARGAARHPPLASD